MSPDIKAISVAVKRYIDTRESQRSALEELRRIAVEQCGFDQGMVLKCNSVVDLLDGFVKGALAAFASASAYDLGDWIEWNGGECPVPEGTLVNVKFANGEEQDAIVPAEEWDWSHGDDQGYDIIAYRVVKEGGAP